MAFTARSNSFCSDALTAIAKLPTPTSPLQKMQYATDRYTIVEKAVSELTDSSLPSGANGAALRDHWLRPARASLDAGRATMTTLRDAVHSGDTAATGPAFAATRSVGTAGVDTDLLRARGLDRCAVLFTPDESP